MENFSVEQISLDKIDLEDRTYVFSYPKREKFLKDSIKKFGLLNPPTLFLSSEKNKYIIIDGEGRILAYRSLGLKSIPSCIITGYTSKELLLISLESNLFRSLNLIEKAEFIKRALKIFSMEEVLGILPKLGFAKNYIWIEFLQNINKLEDEFKNLLILEKLNPKITQILAKLTKFEREEFLELLKKLNLSFSEQKDILEKLLDLKKRNNLNNLLSEELKKILEEKDFNKRKKEFLNKLKEFYYVHYFSKLRKISPVVEKFKAKNINLDFVPYFEKKEINIQFKGKNMEEISKKIEFLTKNHEDIKYILERI